MNGSNVLKRRGNNPKLLPFWLTFFPQRRAGLYRNSSFSIRCAKRKGRFYGKFRQRHVQGCGVGVVLEKRQATNSTKRDNLLSKERQCRQIPPHGTSCDTQRNRLNIKIRLSCRVYHMDSIICVCDFVLGQFKQRRPEVFVTLTH